MSESTHPTADENKQPSKLSLWFPVVVSAVAVVVWLSILAWMAFRD